jgi:hypothetical protein
MPAKMANDAPMQTIIVITETPYGDYEDEFEVEADATDEQIEDAARDVFANRCSYGWHRKEDDGGE